MCMCIGRLCCPFPMINADLISDDSAELARFLSSLKSTLCQSAGIQFESHWASQFLLVCKRESKRALKPYTV